MVPYFDKRILKNLIFLSGLVIFVIQSMNTFATFFEARKGFSLTREINEFVEPPTMMFCPKNFWNQKEEMQSNLLGEDKRYF